MQRLIANSLMTIAIVFIMIGVLQMMWGLTGSIHRPETLVLLDDSEEELAKSKARARRALLFFAVGAAAFFLSFAAR